MAPDEMFRKYQEAGADFLETARARAEEFLRELGQVGDTGQRQAQDVVDDLFETSRRGSEHLFGIIRREITAQLSALGLATREDLEALERRLTGRVAMAKPADAAAKKAAAKKSPAKKSAAKKSAAKKSAGEKVPGKKVPAKKAAAKKAAGST